MTMNEARAALTVPTNLANNNCVQDAQARLREVLALTGRVGDDGGDSEAPSYVVERVRWLKNWIASV